MNTMTRNGPNRKGRKCRTTDGMILLEVEEGRTEEGGRAFEFTIRSYDADPGENLIRLTPRDLPKLLCVAHAVSGYLGTYDDLDPRLAGLMRHVRTFLNGFWADPSMRWERRVGCPPAPQ